MSHPGSSRIRTTKFRDQTSRRFIEVDGVRLHYTDQGEGEPLLLLHGTGMMVQDFATSEMMDLATKRFRVIAIDRPGFGYSEQPPTTK